MQNVQKLKPLVGQQPVITPLRVTTFRPSIWGRVRRWTKKTLTAETVAEIAFGTATVFLVVSLFVGLSRALAQYTIIPLP